MNGKSITGKLTAFILIVCMIVSNLGSGILVQASENETLTKSAPEISWLTKEGNKSKAVNESVKGGSWTGTLQIEDSQQEEAVTYILNMKEKFTGEIVSKTPQYTVEKKENGTWAISGKQSEGDDVRISLAVSVNKSQNQEHSSVSVEGIYLQQKDTDRKNTEPLSLHVTFEEETNTDTDVSEPETTEVDGSDKAEQQTEPNQIETKEENQDPQADMTPFAGSIADLVASEVYSKENPYSGEYFDMTVRVNSLSTGNDKGVIKNLKVEVTLPAPGMIQIVRMPSSNSYTVSTQVSGGETLVTIQYLKDITVGEMVSIPFGLKYLEGVSLPGDILEGHIKASGDNVNSTESSLKGISPQNKPANDKLSKEVEPDAEAVLLHTAKLFVGSEETIGGLNVKNGNLHIEFPQDIILYSVEYAGQIYEVQGPTDGKFTVDIPVGNINVGSGDKAHQVEITYEYPYSDTGSDKTYEITATLTGERWNGEAVNETEIIEDIVPAAGAGPLPGILYFKKIAPERVLKASDVILNYKLVMMPKTDLKDVYLVDDPTRGGNEDNFFDGFRYQSFSWSSQPSKDPSVTGYVDTEIRYQTNKSDIWESMGAAARTGFIKVDNLGLDADEYITNVKYVYSYGGNKEIPRNAGYVTVSAAGKTQSGIVDNTGSLADGITNTAYIYGDRKAPGAGNDYVPFIPGGYEANNDDSNNTKSVTTLYKGEGAYPGYIGWETPFYPTLNTIGSTFTYQIGVNNVYGSGPLRDAILYIEVPASINIESVELMNPSANPDAQIIIQRVNSEWQLVTVKYNNDWPQGEGWNYNHGVRIKANGSINVKGSEIFNNIVTSGYDGQAYDGGAAWYNVQGVGNVQGALSRWLEVKFDRSVGLQSKTEVSEDGIQFDRIINLKSVDEGEEVTYKLTVPNNGEVPINELHIIDKLPALDDKMTVSDANKNSTLSGKVTGISSGGAALGSNYVLSYSTDATSENNRYELENLTSDQSTWIPWDGVSELPEDAVALKIIKKDGIQAKETLELEFTYKITKSIHVVDTIWNSFAVGGTYMDGNSQVKLAIGEPMKSGIYVSEQDADKEIGGVVWRDDNGNGIRDGGEIRISNAVVRLYDWNNDLVKQVNTNGAGEYKFTDLYARSYRVEIDRPNSGYSLTAYQAGDDRSIDNDFTDLINSLQTGEAVVDLETESHPLNIDAGYMEGINIQGYIWYDENYNGIQDAFEPPVVGNSVSLYRIDDNDQKVFVQSTVTKANGKYYFTNSGLKPGKYVIKADIPGGYSVTVKGATPENKNSKFNLDGTTDMIEIGAGTSSGWDMGINENASTTQVSGQKIWVDYGNKFGTRPDSIQVKLLQDGVEYLTKQVQPDENDQWNFTFTNLPEYNQDGIKYVYTLEEVNVDGYTTEINPNTNTITNTYINMDKVAIEGKKIWNDYENQFSTRPDSITVQVFQNGELYKEQKVTAPEGQTNAWTFTVANLPKCDENGTEYVYTLGEVGVSQYTADIDNNTSTITNTYVNTDKVSIDGKKV
ncbi:MAG TPA: Cna B-type domain-containing protein, partial [Candidatus Pelethocola excrementipullorum]|nr:Cna B-type domain-containing protein [Candidatus Pelethocola excrementipullorum]